MALIKIGIFLLAQKGYRVKSRPGRHQKITEAIAAILGIEDVFVIGDKMRKNRNMDVYSTSAVMTDKEVQEYLKFVEEIYGHIY